MNRLLRRQQVIDLVGLSRSTIYSYMSKNLFPRPIKIGVRAVAWDAHLLAEWIANRPASVGGMI
jgi:prophage regulatory protein